MKLFYKLAVLFFLCLVLLKIIDCIFGTDTIIVRLYGVPVFYIFLILGGVSEEEGTIHEDVLDSEFLE